MLSNRYERKFLKHLNKNLKWATRLQHRAKFLNMLTDLSIIPAKIRLKFNKSDHWSWIGVKYLKFSNMLIDKSDQATNDYSHLANLNNSVANKFLKTVETEAKDHE